MAIEEAQIDIVIPTGVNVVLMVNQNIISNLRRNQESNLSLPSLYRRALLVVGETTEVAIVNDTRAK